MAEIVPGEFGGPAASTNATWSTTDSGAVITGDGTTMPKITFSTAGTYDVTALVTQYNLTGSSAAVPGTDSANVVPAGGTGGLIDSVTISDPTLGSPVDGFQTYRFNATITGTDVGMTYQWSVTGDGTISGDSTLSYADRS